MTDISKWEGGRTLTPEEEPEYLKDLCAYLRQQQTLSEPKENEDGVMTCEVVDDEIAAHVADIIEELWSRLDEQYKEGIVKGMQIAKDNAEYEAARGKVETKTPDYLEKCPNCGGPADNGFDRSWPDPNPYYCTKCMEAGEY